MRTGTALKSSVFRVSVSGFGTGSGGQVGRFGFREIELMRRVMVGIMGAIMGNNGPIMRGELWGSFVAWWRILDHDSHGPQRYRNKVLDMPTVLD